jgi:hypothetical protein
MSRYVKFFAACANFPVARGDPKWGFASAKTPGTPVQKFDFFAAFARDIPSLGCGCRARFCAIRNTFACEITELEEAVIGEKERPAKTSGLTLRAPVGDIKGSNPG